MKTQISRDSHRPERRYSAVYQQMGRMITDADLNELAEIVKTRLDDALHDVIDSGSPKERGVRISKAGAGQPLQFTPGYAYADGVIGRISPGEDAAAPFGFTDQADFPGAPPPPDASFLVYLDIWERAVSSVEDEREAEQAEVAAGTELPVPGLRDPALHGADTATRTQTMAQLKWGPAGADLPAASGDARLTVRLRETVEEADDECDPCAADVDVEARTGNYLFRLEVHDVTMDSGQITRLVLKWSSENGAEHHRVGTEPNDFTAADRAFEFYRVETEKHLGMHLASGFSPGRGNLTDEYPADPAVTFPDNDLVRRWDGYCTLDRSSTGAWTLDEGIDRGNQLTPDLSGGNFEATLQAVVLHLELEGPAFVAGDYWLATIREDDKPGDGVVLKAEPPRGIVHHYVTVGTVDGSGEVAELSTEALRRLNFPALTNLTAPDVGYDTNCDTGLFDSSHDTVKKALDQICNIAAEHVAYQAPEDCELLDAATTVQEAIDELCRRPAGDGGCEVVVGTNGQFETINEAIAEMREETNALCICLQGETHVLEPVEDLDGFRLTIRGCAGSRVRVSGEVTFNRLAWLGLHNLAIDLEQADGVRAIDCVELVVEGCDFFGAGREQAQLGIQTAGTATIERSAFRPDTEQMVELRAKLEEIFEPLATAFESPLSADELHRNVQKVVEVLLEEAASLPDVAELLISEQIPGAQHLVQVMNATEPRESGLTSALIDMRRTASGMSGTAVGLIPAGGNITIRGCDIEGALALGGFDSSDQELPVSLDELANVVHGDTGVFDQAAGSLRLVDSAVARMAIGNQLMEEISQLPGGGVVATTFRTVFFADDTIFGVDNHVVARDIKLTANDFATLLDAEQANLGFVVGDSAIFVGNRANTNQHLVAIARLSRPNPDGNVLNMLAV